ncbi:MAG TPA: DUF268 domain-containing protein [Acidobacteriota bacterium]|nr:DUF268 domain-containing protein [Acidobacteriota bacterium]
MNEASWVIRKIAASLSPFQRIKEWRASLGAWRRFWREYRLYKSMCPPEMRPMVQDLSPFVKDNTQETPIEPVYFYQDAWAFEKICARKVKHHIDVGSHHKYVSLLSKVVPTTFVDIRPPSIKMESIAFQEATITALPFEDQSVESISSLCVVEHIGLGRYGDPLDPHGTENAIRELCRVLAPNGHLYVSLPVGETSYVAFNEGRILSRNEFLELIKPLRLSEQKYIVQGRYQNEYEPSPGMGTIGLFELTRD